MQDLSNPNTLLIILGIIAIIIEVALGAALGFELLIIGAVFVVGGLVGLASGSLMIALISITVLIVFYIFFARSRIKKSLDITTKKTNMDLIMGKVARVVKPIKPHEPGQVKIEGEVWRAESAEELVEGQKVIVKSVSGVTVLVEKES